MDISLTCIVAFIVCLVVYIYNSNRTQKINLPGPPGLPIVGNFFDVDFQKIHLKLFTWSKTYGDIFQLRFFGQNFVIINSSKILRELFSKEPNATLTSARPDTFAKEYLTLNSDVVTSSLDKEWIKRRKLMHKVLYTYAEGQQQFEKGINWKLSNLTREIDHLTCDPRDLIDDFVISTIEILLVGKCQERGSEFHNYITDLDTSANALGNPGVDTIYKNFPVLRWLPLPPNAHYKRFIKLRDGLLKFLDKQPGNRDVGIYPTMKKMLQMEGIGEEGSASCLNEQAMLMILLNVLGGAYLTTRSTLLSMIRILMSVPKVRVKLQEEVDRVIGPDRRPLPKDRPNLPYCEAVTLETLRYISHVPLSIVHSASEDISVNGLTIPKGTAIIPSLWTIHHSVKEWKDPFQFNPERFMTNDGEILPADSETRKRFLAFGYGKRSCLGEVFAKMRIFLFLSTLMQTYTVLPPDDEIPPLPDPREMTAGSVLQPKPFSCKFVKRT